MPANRAQDELKRVVERAVARACDLPRPGLWFCVDHARMRGHPPERSEVRATLHFLAEGSPFCCGEPGCHLGPVDGWVEEVSSHIRRAVRPGPRFSVDFGDRIGVHYHAGIRFRYGRGPA